MSETELKPLGTLDEIDQLRSQVDQWKAATSGKCMELFRARAELEKCQCEVQQLKGFEVVLKEICDIAIEPPNTNEGVKDAVQRIKNERDAAKDHAKGMD